MIRLLRLERLIVFRLREFTEHHGEMRVEE